MLDKAALRALVRENLDSVMQRLNGALSGDDLRRLEPVLTRLGRGGELPHWYPNLKKKGVLPNLDGKSIGSVLEMLFVAILETGLLKGSGACPMRINPARGVDLPDLDLGIKSPSENFCTSEPFFSAYERLYGNENDCVVVLTDYQSKKNSPPLKLKAISWTFLKGSEVADRGLCRIARRHREWLLTDGDARAARVFKFLAYVNQSDWRAKKLLSLLESVQSSDDWFDSEIKSIEMDFVKQNKSREKKGAELIPDLDLVAIRSILNVTPRYMGLIDQLENWLNDALRDACRPPNENEWKRLRESPLDGRIGMSFALQWRYNFSQCFPRASDLRNESR